jgi:hypothetical protein
MLLYVVCTAGEFVWNEGGVGPATCNLRLISLCVIYFLSPEDSDPLDRLENIPNIFEKFMQLENKIFVQEAVINNLVKKMNDI